MPFVEVGLARAIEAAAVDLLRQCALATAQRRPEPVPGIRELGGGIAVLTEPGSPLAKVAGLGFAAPPADAELEAVEREFATRGVPLQIEVASMADPEIGRRLTRRGYLLLGFENVLGRDLRLPLPALAAPRIQVTADAGLATWADLLLEGFATPDAQGIPSHESFPREALAASLLDLAAVPGFVRFVAWRDGNPAGAGSLHLAGPIAQLCGTATLPRHRRAGVQTALLRARLASAAAAGAELAVVTVQPGSKSQQNMQRHGFELLYVRAILVHGAAA